MYKLKLNSLFKSLTQKRYKSFKNYNSINNDKNLKILFGPTFSIHNPSVKSDRLFAASLLQMGCDVTAIYCDGVQKEECNVYGGEWQGKNWNKSCKYCQKCSKKSWNKFSKVNLLKLSSFLNDDDYDYISSLLENSSFEEMLNFHYEGVDYGRLGKDLLVNNYLVASPQLVPRGEILLRTHIENLLLLNICYDRIVLKIKPDRVITNDSYYGMWNILENVCGKYNIPFYSHYPVTKSRCAISFNEAAMNLSMKTSWNKFQKIPLNQNDIYKIRKWVDGDRDFVIDASKPFNNSENDLHNLELDTTKPLILLSANITWDLAALNKNIFFEDMNEWIVETISWFNKNPEFQLLIKPHPAETAPSIPKTNERVIDIISSNFCKLPPNVFLLKSNTTLTIKKIIGFQNLRGVIVHTSTVGFEFPANGIPAIVTGQAPYRDFGFTTDPNTKDEYFENLEKLCKNKIKLSKEHSLLAKKFIKFFHFHFYHKLIDSQENLLSDRSDLKTKLDSIGNPLGYIINRIINGLPIIDENNWIPES